MSLIEGIFGRAEDECVSGKDVRAGSAQGPSLRTLPHLEHSFIVSSLQPYLVLVAGIIFGLVYEHQGKIKEK